MAVIHSGEGKDIKMLAVKFQFLDKECNRFEVHYTMTTAPKEVHPSVAGRQWYLVEVYKNGKLIVNGHDKFCGQVNKSNAVRDLKNAISK